MAPQPRGKIKQEFPYKYEKCPHFDQLINIWLLSRSLKTTCEISDEPKNEWDEGTSHKIEALKQEHSCT